MLCDVEVNVKTEKMLGHRDLSVTMKIFTYPSEKKET